MKVGETELENFKRFNAQNADALLKAHDKNAVLRDLLKRVLRLNSFGGPKHELPEKLYDDIRKAIE